MTQNTDEARDRQRERDAAELHTTIGRFALGLMLTGVGAWIAAIASFSDREPTAGALCLAVGALAFGWGLSALLRSLR